MTSKENDLDDAVGRRFFDLPGEMAKLIRGYNWAQSSLGALSTWSPSLINTVALILRAHFPMLLCWGNDLIQFYNDAYRPSLGLVAKHPEALGQKGADCWPEVWEIIKPQIDMVMKTGQATCVKDALVPVYRNGQLEDIYWTYSFSQVIDAEGGAGGVLVIVNETTEQVFAEQKMAVNLKGLAESEKRLRYLLADAPAPIAVLQGESLIVESANNKMLEVWHRAGEAVIGKSIALALPELEKQGFVDVLNEVYLSGKPYFGNEARVFIETDNNHVDDLYATFVFQPIKDEQGNTSHIMIVANIITEQVLARQKVEQAEEMLRLSIEAANVGTWTMDMDTGKLVASDRLKELFGFESSVQVSFEDLLSRVPIDFVSKINDNMSNALLTGEDYVSEHQIILAADQNERWVKALGKMYIDEATHARQFSGLMIDVTEEKIDNRRKNDFIGMVSHELKTPITSLSAYLQLLHIRSIQEKDTFSTEILNKVNHQVRKMSTMINSFLNLSRLESGKIALLHEDFDLVMLIDEVIEETLITSKMRKIEKHLPELVMVNADYDKIFSVVSNLISNAVKYSGADTLITIAAEINEQEVIVSVKDRGMGINKGEIKKLFDRYYRAESNITKHISGFGIGLYLASEIIQKHKGKIWVDTEIGKGSTFYFSLPK